MAEYYPPIDQHHPQHQYPQHIPPHHVAPPHVPPQTKSGRRRNPPASTTKLHRPLTRFYCNDCKKKFRSRILANRNNNAVQHYCQLYQKIITRKVDSHSNKCKGDHGPGACVVKRTDEDPDSDGEDETKAAYYADKGKTPKPRRARGAYSTKKRKRSDDDGSYCNEAKRPRLDPAPSGQEAQYPPPPMNGGYYHRAGYVHHGQQLNGQRAPDPQHNGTLPHPPPIEFHDGNSSTPPIPMAVSTAMAADSESVAPRIEDGTLCNDAVPPPPPLEEITARPPIHEMESKSDGMGNAEDSKKGDEVLVTVDGNDAAMATVDDGVVVAEEEEECINDEITEDDDDEDLNLEAPTARTRPKDGGEEELNLEIPHI